jgi:hypothetical protein
MRDSTATTYRLFIYCWMGTAANTYTLDLPGFQVAGLAIGFTDTTADTSGHTIAFWNSSASTALFLIETTVQTQYV